MGFGHVSRMNAVSQREEFNDCEWHFALQEVHKYHSIARCHPMHLWQAPYVRLQSKQTSVNFSHLLARCGFVSLASAQALVASWQNLIVQIKPDAILLDHSPGAAAAAQLLGIPFVHIGNGFEVPKVQDPMPAMQPLAKVEQPALIETDKALHQVMDALEYDIARTRTGALHLNNLYHPDKALIAGYPSLDHYGERDATWRYLDVRPVLSDTQTELPEQPVEGERRIFFYLDVQTPNVAEILPALAGRFSVFGTLRGPRTPALNAALRKAGVKVFDEPLPVDYALSHADLVFCHSGAGLMNNVFARDMPSLLLPLQLEQSMMAYQISHKGLAMAVGKQPEPAALATTLSEQWGKLPDISGRMKAARREDELCFWRGDILTDLLHVS